MPPVLCASAEGCQGGEQPSSFLTCSRCSGLTSPVPGVEKRRREGQVLTGEGNTPQPPPTQPRQFCPKLEGRRPARSPGRLHSCAPLNSGTAHPPPARPQNNSLPAPVGFCRLLASFPRLQAGTRAQKCIEVCFPVWLRERMCISPGLFGSFTVY